MNLKSKQTISVSIVLLAAAVITSVIWFKKRNRKPVDDYDWIMW